MEVFDFDYDTEAGIAWANVESRSGDILIIECSLESDGNGKYFKSIDSNDCGHDQGVCGNGNQAAFAEFGKEKCMKAFFEEAEKCGVKVV